MRKFFPLAGQPNLYVQWAETDAHKAYRDPDYNPGVVGPPSHFKGHLVNRKDLGKNYEPVFVFYDCLKNHYLGRCNRCLGVTSQDTCRDTFVCAENNDKALCDAIRSRSETSIREELDALKTSGGESRKIQSLEAVLTAKREHRIAVQSVKLEELAQLAERLEKAAEQHDDTFLDDLSKTRRDLFALRLDELEIRAQNAFRTVSAMTPAVKTETENAISTLDARRKEKASLTKSLEIMRIFINIGDELERLQKRSRLLKKKAPHLTFEELAKLASFDPDTSDGKQIIEAIGALEAVIAGKERTLWNNMVEAAADGGVDADARDAGVDGNDAAVMAIPIPPVTETLRANPDYQKLRANLDRIISRADTLLSKLKVLIPGQIKAFDEWAAMPDVLGTIPKGLRETRVIGAIARLEEMLAAAPAAGEGMPLLAEAYNSKIDELEALEKQIAGLEKKPGLLELKLTDKLAKLKTMAKEQPTAVQSLQGQMEQLLAELLESGMYSIKLKGAPEEMSQLEKLLAPEKLSPIDSVLKRAEERLSPGDWVLIDGEVPLDKIWVIAVYLVLLSMIVVNLRKLWRFFMAYK